ncbi:MAG: MBL fold metallo-hydrolase [Oligoflexales bacterium]|nr:MBL fold metallo-hydrolase [Oligoflexales bacterium]
MKMKFWGTRGSLPRSYSNQDFNNFVKELINKAESKGISTLKEFSNAMNDAKFGAPLLLGGHTSCTEIIHEKEHFFIDSGTGITDAAVQVLKEGQNEFRLFQTHMHWDHIMGLPFFLPIYIPGIRITIYHVHPITPEYIKLQFNGVNFPVPWEQLGSTIEFKKINLYEKMQFGSVTVSAFCLDHPGGSFGYRFDAGGKSIAIGVDGEYKRLTPENLGNDLKYFQNLDLLTFDAQYAMNELVRRFDWGHCTPSIGVDLALREGVKTLVLNHHDSRRTEADSFKMLKDAKDHLKTQLPAYQEIWNRLKQPKGPNVLLGYDGLEIDLDAT